MTDVPTYIKMKAYLYFGKEFEVTELGRIAYYVMAITFVAIFSFDLYGTIFPHTRGANDFAHTAALCVTVVALVVLQKNRRKSSSQESK